MEDDTQWTKYLIIIIVMNTMKIIQQFNILKEQNVLLKQYCMIYDVFM